MQQDFSSQFSNRRLQTWDTTDFSTVTKEIDHLFHHPYMTPMHEEDMIHRISAVPKKILISRKIDARTPRRKIHAFAVNTLLVDVYPHTRG